LTIRPDDKLSKLPDLKTILRRLKRILTHQWGVKLICFLLAIVLWGGLISQDNSLTREKSFTDVAITVPTQDALERIGLIVVEGLENLPGIQMRATVPQRNYNSTTASNYNVRVDLSRITAPGEQTIPLISTSSTLYGQVTWLSTTEIKVKVDDYITRRRIPVQLGPKSSSPVGFYAPPASVEPAAVVISGPRQVTMTVARAVAHYDAANLAAQAGTQLSAVPFSLETMEGDPIDTRLITVTSNESIVLDTVQVEQQLYPLKTVDIDLSGITMREPAAGYQVKSVTASPSYLSVAGTNELLKSLTMLEVSSRIDIGGAEESLVRAVKVEKPQNAQYMSEDAVYVTIEIVPITPETEAPT